MTWDVLAILVQFAAACALAWAVLWLIDRLGDEPEWPIDPVEILAAWEPEPPAYTNLDEAQAAYHRKLVEFLAMTHDEAREAEGLPNERTVAEKYHAAWQESSRRLDAAIARQRRRR